MSTGNMYVVQHSFTTGEISPEIENRSDLDKYRSAVLMAKNCIIRPYGSICKRNGTRFIGEAKYPNRKVRLIRFVYPEPIFLEVGHLYIRIWKNDRYTGIELTTPYEESILNELDFNQSADTFFICSGLHPIHMLQRIGNEWEFKLFDLVAPPFDDINTDRTHKIKYVRSSNKVISTKSMFKEGMVGQVIKIKHRMPAEVKKMTGRTEYVSERRLWHRHEYEVPGYESMDIGSYADDTDKEWKIVTHGTWYGTITIQKKDDTETTAWENYRQYSSNGDYNVTETGSFNRGTQLRILSEITSGDVSIDFTIKPYDQYGMIVISRFISPTEVEAKVLKPVGKETETSEWQLSSWGKEVGYPRMSTFFQDRLVLGGSKSNPYKLWFSRTGDYPNFEVEKADGNVTDDSAITLGLISRAAFNIVHMISAQDLIVLTDGNEWVISGSEAIKPSKVVPRSQTQHGASNCDTQYIGNRLIYVQKRSSSVRDMGYTYESDNYNGIDLTLLAKHLVNQHSLVDSTFAQQPDSILYYVRDDGKLIALTIIREQDVTGWAHHETKDGVFETICSVANGNEDSVYAVVKRTVLGQEKRYIERLDSPVDSKDVSNYTTLDCSITITNNTQTSIRVEHLKGMDVVLLLNHSDVHQVQVGQDGTVILPYVAKDIAIGIPIECKIVLPQVYMDMKDGTLQSRTIRSNSMILRLRNSRGGKVGVTFNRGMDLIGDASLIQNGSTMYTGDININIPTQGKGYATDASVCILHDDPFPFNLLSVVRDVSIGGGTLARYNNKTQW